MSREDERAAYLESGSGPVPADARHLDTIRSVLAAPATWGEPPPDILARLPAQREGRQLPAPPRWPGLAAALGVAAAVIALVWSTVAVVTSPTETVVALSGGEAAPTVSAVVTLRPTDSGWWIRLDPSHLPAAPEGSYYEGWVWDGEGTGVAIGTFHMRGGPEPVILWAGVDLRQYRRISVTLEPEGGGPEPSDQVVLRGEMPSP